MKIKTMKKRIVIAISLGAAFFGAIAYAATTVILAEGAIFQSELFNGPAAVTVRTLTIGPGEVLAWHYHPGYAYNVIKSGTLTVEDGCGGEERLSAGQAFEELDGRVHRAKNLSATEDVLVYNTFIVPKGKPTTRNIPGNQRRCGPPEDVNECKNEGWLRFTHPRNFADEEDCVQFVLHRPRNIIPVPEDPLN
jgi:quercetin dioxygenase-like cupin family protein